MISRNVLLISRKFFPDSNEVIDMLRELFRFVKRDIEHNIDTVRHQTKQLLVNMIKYSKSKFSINRFLPLLASLRKKVSSNLQKWKTTNDPNLRLGVIIM